MFRRTGKRPAQRACSLLLMGADNKRKQISAGNTTTGRSRSVPTIQQQAEVGERQKYNNRQKQVTPVIRQPPGTGLLRRPPSVRRTLSAQLYMANTAAYRHLPIHYRIPQRRTATCPERGSARGKNGLRNSECLSPSQTCPRPSVPLKGKEPHAQVSPRKGKEPTAQSVPPEKKLSVKRHRPSAQERTSDARHCTISGTIFPLILSIVHSLVYYKEHTSNLLTLKSESVILWSS